MENEEDYRDDKLEGMKSAEKPYRNEQSRNGLTSSSTRMQLKKEKGMKQEIKQKKEMEMT